MKRFTSIVMAFLISIPFLSGCGNSTVEYEKKQLQAEVEKLQTEVDNLRKVREGLIQKDDVVYVIELEISQSHFTFDLEEHLKDEMNTITIPIRVSEEYYHSVEVGDILSDEVRIGSLIMKGSLGSWDIKIADKQTVSTAE